MDAVHDKMTQCRYTTVLTTFDLDISPEDVFEVDILHEGKSALQKANKELGSSYRKIMTHMYITQCIHV